MKPGSDPSRRSRFNLSIAMVLQGIIVAGLALEIYERQWPNVVIVTGILMLTMLPSVLSRRVQIQIPPEFELLTIAFIFAALFLGEIRDYYGRFWWWDLMLHTTSGGLLGIFGVLLVYVLNENPRIGLDLQPGFVAFFAFCFAVAVGSLWEVFEFAMDESMGMNMQKPMLGDPSGLTDTMWDLTVDSLGALAVAMIGYRFMKRGAESMVQRWIQRFIDANPRLFSRGSPR